MAAQTPRSGDSGPAWLALAAARVGRWCRGEASPRWVVAVSGGGDSVGLLRMLHAVGPGVGLGLVVAHLDHGVRGEAAAADARFVAELADRLGLPCELGRWQPARAGHFEADARRARYAWLDEVARARGASSVAVGHTRDDQAETILHRIVRGTGLRGLRGMPARRALSDSVNLVRPLLHASREELRAYLVALGQPFRDDASNADLGRTRARIRHDLLPKLAAEYNPRVAEALVRLGGLAGASERALARRLARLADQAIREANPAEVVLDLAPLSRLPAFLRAEVLRLAWRRQGWREGALGADDWLQLADLARAGREVGRCRLKLGVIAHRSGSTLRLVAGTPEPWIAPAPVDLPVPGCAAWGGGRIVATLDPDAPRDEAIDADRLEPFAADDGAPQLVVRAPADGDRFAPLGMGGRAMALNDFFRGRRVERAARRVVPLVCDRRGIVWVVGHRIADRVRVGPGTVRTLGLRWEGGSELRLTP